MLLGQSISKNSLILGVFSIITTGVIVFTQGYTKPYIEEAKAKALKAALHEVVPPSSFDNALIDDTLLVKADALLGTKDQSAVYLARKEGRPVAAIFQATAPEGYGGSINLLIGVNYDGSLSGVRVVPPHAETPGLGDAIDLQKSDWILSFNGKSLTDPKDGGWKVKKDGGIFDAFTGATITPRAVVDAVHKTLQYFKKHQLELFIPPVEHGPDRAPNMEQPHGR